MGLKKPKHVKAPDSVELVQYLAKAGDWMKQMGLSSDLSPEQQRRLRLYFADGVDSSVATNRLLDEDGFFEDD